MSFFIQKLDFPIPELDEGIYQGLAELFLELCDCFFDLWANTCHFSIGLVLLVLSFNFSYGLIVDLTQTDFNSLDNMILLAEIVEELD